MSLRRGVFWSFLQGTGGRVLRFATTIVMARLLVPEDFGLIATVQVFTGVAGLISGGGIMQALVRQKDCSPADLNTGFTVQFLIAGALFLFFYVLVAPLASQWLADPRYLDLIRVSALGFFVRPFYNSASTNLQREMRFRVLAVNTLWSILLGSAVSITMAMTGFGVWSLVLGGLVGSTTNSLLNSLAARWMPRPALNLDSVRGFYRAGSGFALINVVHHLSEKGITLAISKLMGPAPLGIFNKGQSLAVMPTELGFSALNKPLFRAMARESDNHQTIHYLFVRAVVFMAVMTWPVLTLFAWYSEPLIVLLYGEHWRAAGQVLQIIAVASLFRTFEQPSRILLTSGAGLRTYILILGLGTLALIGATIYLVEHGLYAVAMGIAAIQVGLFLVLLIQAMRLHQIPARAILAGIAAPLFALMGMFGTLVLLGTPTGALYMTGWIGILGQILAACITYAVILVLFPHSLAREELLRLLGRVRMPRS
jgi:O-antigen/teichoic acid export membrane protein